MNSKLLLAALMLLVVHAVHAVDYPPITVAMPIKQVSEHCYYAAGAPGAATDNEGFISNAGFIVTDDGVVVLDALGSPSLGKALLDNIRKVTDKPIRIVVVTHYHADHVYGLQVFQDEGAEIIAPRGAYEYIDAPVAMQRLEERRLSLDPWVNDDTRLVRPDRLVEESYEFSLGGIDFLVSYLGSAHSEGDMTLYVAQDRVLYSGDIIFEGRVPFVGEADTQAWVETLRRLETEELAALVPGHGPAARDPVGAVGRTRDYLAYLRETMGAAVDDLQDFESAYVETDWSRYERLPAFGAAHRRNAYQVFLSMEAEAVGE